MRTDLFVERLKDVSADKNASPQKLARLLEVTIKRVADNNVRGEQAYQILKNRILRESYAETVGQRLRLASTNDNRRTPGRPGRKPADVAEKPLSPKKRGVGRPKKTVASK